jgi:hypothetical protein
VSEQEREPGGPTTVATVAVDPEAATAAKVGPRASRARSTATSREVNRAASVGGARLNAMESRQPSPRRTRTQTLRRHSQVRTVHRRNSARWKRAEKSYPASSSAMTDVFRSLPSTSEQRSSAP